MFFSKNHLRVVIVTLFVAASLTIGAQDSTKTKYHAWWADSFMQAPKKNAKAKLLPAIHVYKNKFVNAKGDTILFRGLSISDPDKLEHQGHWNKHHFEKAKEMGTMLVRIPVHPVAWRERRPVKYLQLLDSAVDWCTDLGMYVIIDWHSIGNLRMELFQDPMYNTTQKETYEFWQTISKHFSGNNTVAFYELFNEPTTYNGQLGSISWSEWKKMMEDIIHLIRSFDSQTIPLVAGFDWAYDLTPIREEPVNAENIAYVTHPYPFKRSEPWQPKWEEDFGFAATQYPIIATEIGFDVKAGETIGKNHYGYQITKYLEERGISWTAWVFDPEWWPQMLRSWNYELTDMGTFFKQAMHKAN
ncbi:MAG: cellulase family glycosylhydrolase [Bacteroidetes bacterium]|nr:cellulase family glycosylhydrolase [Bacteroidota bacterium]